MLVQSAPFAQVAREAGEKEADGGWMTPDAGHVQQGAAQGLVAVESFITLSRIARRVFTSSMQNGELWTGCGSSRKHRPQRRSISLAGRKSCNLARAIPHGRAL
jgi:hypothetical protein